MNTLLKLTRIVNDLERHPLSEAWGDLPDDELMALAESIKDVGQREPIILFEGKVLDGWNRNRACEIADVEPRTQGYVETDPVEFVIRKNGLRRQLTASQKAIIAVTVSDWRGRGRPADEDKSLPGRELISTADLAASVGVSKTYIEQAKEVVRGGLADVVKSGAMSVKKAAKTVRKAEKADSAPPVKTPIRNKSKKLTPLEKEQRAHAKTKAERDNLKETLDEVIVDLEAAHAAGLEEDEQAQKFKNLYQQIETHKAQLMEQQHKADGLLNRAKTAERRLRRYEG